MQNKVSDKRVEVANFIFSSNSNAKRERGGRDKIELQVDQLLAKYLLDRRESCPDQQPPTAASLMLTNGPIDEPKIRTMSTDSRQTRNAQTQLVSDEKKTSRPKMICLLGELIGHDANLGFLEFADDFTATDASQSTPNTVRTWSARNWLCRQVARINVVTDSSN